MALIVINIFTNIKVYVTLFLQFCYLIIST